MWTPDQDLRLELKWNEAQSLGRCDVPARKQRKLAANVAFTFAELFALLSSAKKRKSL